MQDWEYINQKAKFGGKLYRMKVPGGWLVRSVSYKKKSVSALTMTNFPLTDELLFIQDSQYAWEIDETIEWEVIKSKVLRTYGPLLRLPITGGWLVKVFAIRKSLHSRSNLETLIFMSDPDRQWRLEQV